MPNMNPEAMARAVLEACADCDICRYLMEDTACLVFPELYRLYDKESVQRESISPDELRNLVHLCNFCALCPCPEIRSDLMKAKSAFIDRDGLKPTIRLLEDVERVSMLCGAYPALTNALLKNRFSGPLLKRLAGIHDERKLPVFPNESFPAWVRQRGIHIMRSSAGRKVAYFAGCTGQYLFPDVPVAVVEVLQRNGVEVYCPEQKCCGMPSLLEGDRGFTLELATLNLERLNEAVEAGYDVICSCPTCGYMLKSVMTEGACHASHDDQSSGRHRSTPIETRVGPEAGRIGAQSPSQIIFAGLFRDEGYFASLDARKRMKVANHTYDLGEYLRNLHSSGDLNLGLGSVAAHMAYYPPCHQREQKIGEPWADLLGLVPGLDLEKIDGSFHCCGIAGIMGFKRDFHEVSVSMGGRLTEKIRSIHPETLLTDCLSCRIQFNQLISYKVLHPVEIFREAYDKFQK